MVSLIGTSMSTCSNEDSILTTVDKLGCVEMTRDDSGRCDEDDALEVLMVLDSVEQDRLHQI